METMKLNLMKLKPIKAWAYAIDGKPYKSWLTNQFEVYTSYRAAYKHRYSENIIPILITPLTTKRRKKQ